MKTTLTITMLVLFSLGTLAQRPAKNLQTPQDIRSKRVSERNAFHRQKNDDRQLRHTEFSSPGHLKAAQAIPSEKMDSMIYAEWRPQPMNWKIFVQEYFEYDSLGNNTLDTWFGTDYDTVFPSYGSMVEFAWDANNRLVEMYDYDWSDSTGFMLYSKDLFDYDASGNQTVEIDYNWNKVTQSYYPSYTDTSTYDGMGNKLENASYRYDTMLMAWDPDYRDTYVYDSTGTRTQGRDYRWNPDSSRWDENYRMFYYYDAMGRDTSNIQYYWDGFTWRESWKEVYHYDARGNTILEAYFNWDGESIWYGSYKYEYTFNASDAVTEEIEWYWDFDKSEWYMNNKYAYNHDGRGNIIEEAGFEYDTASMTFVNDWKDIYEYDLSLDWANIALPYEIVEDLEDDSSYPILSKLLKYTEFYYDTTLMVWDTAYSQIFYYSQFDGVVVEPVVCNADFRSVGDQNPLTIIFTDASGPDVAAWYWTFGDGSTSTMQSPKHTYKFPGTYKVSLSTRSLSGDCNNTIVQQIKAGTTLCNAEFSMIVDTLLKIVTLTDNSQGSNLSYFWSLGDGQVSSAMNPTHNYSFPGSYDVTLTIQNDAGTCMDRFSLNTRVGTAVCLAEFDVYIDSSTLSGIFTSHNQNPANVYRWEFGDGSVGKTPNVVKDFTHPGYYTAKLTVSNQTEGCVNSLKATVLVGRPSPAGKANFIYVSGDMNKVKFNDRSLGDNLSYFWNFNDGVSSTEQNPMHEYVLPGYYNVCLTVITANGNQNTYCEKIFAGTDTKDECLAQFEYSLSENQLGISCLDRSLGDPDKWKWIFNDGLPTTEQNSSWSTSVPAYVKVQQSIFNSKNGCRDYAFALINMGAEAKLIAGFGFVIDSSNTKASSYPVDFVGVSLGDAGKLKWSFGDETSDSTTINPVHVYSEPGTYNVCLTITNTTTGDIAEDCQMITVDGASSVYREKLMSDNVGLKSYPNPFSESTRIEIQLSENSEIDLSVYDFMGRKIKTIARDQRLAGTHTFNFKGSDIESGNYYLILETENGRARQVISIIR